MFNKVLIANRGEIALRIQRSCRELGIGNVCVYSQVDGGAKYVKLADEAICIGPGDPTKSYLDPAALIAAAEVSGAEAIHPGYGFLSENADFAEMVEASGFVFIGPRPDTIRTMGDKSKAKECARDAGLKLIPGFDIDKDKDTDKLLKDAKKIGYPLMIKASAGGGGRGMRVIHTESMLRNSIGMLEAETERAFGDGSLYIEKLFSSARHVEVQVLGDNHGNVVHLGTRDCSVQRRHQKLIEEAPAPTIPAKALEKIAARSVEACRKIGYVGAGTLEFLYDGDDFYFIEMNTRIQVEHPVTEMITGVDIVEAQIRIAADEQLPYKQKDIRFRGHAFECRVNAEDPVDFTPSPGRISIYHPAGGPGVRIDSHVYADCEVPHNYDSLICKVVTYGADRAQAAARMRRALSEFVLDGIKHNIPLHLRVFADKEFARGGVGIDFLDSRK